MVATPHKLLGEKNMVNENLCLFTWMLLTCIDGWEVLWVWPLITQVLTFEVVEKKLTQQEFKEIPSWKKKTKGNMMENMVDKEKEITWLKHLLTIDTMWF